MLAKIKGYLDSSWTWLVAAVGAILYFWIKERDLENKLEEEKVDATLKTDTTKISDADAAASTQLEHYESLRRQYEADVSDSTSGVRPGSPAPTSTDPNKG